MNSHKQILRSFLIPCLTLFALAGSAHAALMFNVTVNTSSLNTTTGAIEFQFDPGPGTYDAGIADITFTGVTQGTSQTIGDVTFPGLLQLGNTDPVNDFFAPATFTNLLKFTVTFSGAFLTNPSALADAGNAFTFSIYSDAAGNNPVLTTAAGGYVTAQISFDPGSSIPTITNNSTGNPQVLQIVQVTPEPGAALLLGIGLVALWAHKRAVRA